jgi:hypothetical protein
MATVYQHQLHAHRSRRHHYKLWVLAVAVIVIGVVLWLRTLKSDTKITNGKATTSTIAGPATKKFDEPDFTINLPTSWTFIGAQHDINNIYHFRSEIGGDQGNRLLDVYEDSQLSKFAINRMVPVEADGASLTVSATEISDNCTAYTTGPAAQTTVGSIAKWQGINFLCDMANPLRNVVGTGSPDGLNTVVLTGDLRGEHHYFFTYTENNNTPNYTIFTDALTSFQAK